MKAALPCLIQWAGGKSKLVGELTSRLPLHFGTYWEPFAGGLALFAQLSATGQLRQKRVHLSDRLDSLVHTYQICRDQPAELIQLLETLSATKNEKTYLQLRDIYNNRLSDFTPVERAAVFIYINRLCFNGLHRVNSQGKFNVGYRKNGDRDIVRAAVIKTWAEWLQAVTSIQAVDYRECFEQALPGDLVYADPPYEPVSNTSSFNNYSGTFNESSQWELAQACRKLTERRVYLMLSSSDTPAIRKMYTGFQIDTVAAPRSINSKGSQRGPVTELIIRNYLS